MRQSVGRLGLGSNANIKAFQSTTVLACDQISYFRMLCHLVVVVFGQQRGRPGGRAAQGDVLGPCLSEGVRGQRGQVGKVDQLPLPAPALLTIFGGRVEIETTLLEFVSLLLAGRLAC